MPLVPIRLGDSPLRAIRTNEGGDILVVSDSFEAVGGHLTPDISTVYSPTPPEGVSRVIVQALTKNVRFTMSETEPSSTVGFVITAGDPPMIISLPQEGANSLKFIQETAGAELQLQWGY